jgi:tRNA U54 and U55 pseudouridine synthase Pus10
MRKITLTLGPKAGTMLKNRTGRKPMSRKPDVKKNLRPATVKRAAQIMGSYSKLARELNRTYRCLLYYRAEGEAPIAIVDRIERIAHLNESQN